METHKTGRDFNMHGLSKHLMDKKMIGLFGIAFVIGGILGYIPSTIHNSILGMVGFAVLTVIGIILGIYAFSEELD